MITPTLDIEQKLWKNNYHYICGLDEVGRGCFAGPVVVGAVVFPKDVILPEGIADSKLLTPQRREKLAEEIKKVALGWAVAEISVLHINNVGIGKATQMAFRDAVKNLSIEADFLLIDAFFIDGIDREIQKAVKGGDKICASISAASIVAKVYRDDLMRKLHLKYPEYNFAKNKGYGTKDHRDSLKKHGFCEIHRKSFSLDRFLI